MILGSGGSPAANFIRSLRDAPEKFWIVGTEVSQYEIFRSEADETYITPYSNHPKSIEILQDIIDKTSTEFVHAQPDVEILNLSRNRDKLGAATFLPAKKTIEICMNKVSSYECWEKAGLKVPKTALIKNPADLEKVWMHLALKYGYGRFLELSEKDRCPRIISNLQKHGLTTRMDGVIIALQSV